MNPKEPSVGLIIFLVVYDLGSLRIAFLIELVLEIELLWLAIESKPSFIQTHDYLFIFIPKICALTR